MGTYLLRTAQGSPPHTRGKHFLCAIFAFVQRITPAYAGKTISAESCDGLGRDHPRIRGENFATLLYKPLAIGSPPHTRGKHNRTEFESSDIRITPAYAGKTAKAERTVAAVWDHPRIRGENFNIIKHGTFGTGSPPHTRGKLSNGLLC